MNYLHKMSRLLEKANEKALSYGDAKAWDNAKAKNCKRYLPRGKMFFKLKNQESNKILKGLKEGMEQLKQLTEKDYK